MSQKITKSTLKSIIKECLVELLTEGLGNMNIVERTHVYEQKQLPERKAPPQREAMPVRRTASLDTPIDELRHRQLDGLPPMGFENASDADLGNPFRPEVSLNENESYRFVEHINGNPDQIFGKETASKWAALAFASSGK